MAAQKITLNGQELNVYQFLGVDEKATEEALRSAYRKICFEYHPDRNPEKRELFERNFKVVQEAWGFIATPQARAKYDRQLALERGQISDDWRNVIQINIGGGWYGSWHTESTSATAF